VAVVVRPHFDALQERGLLTYDYCVTGVGLVFSPYGTLTVSITETLVTAMQTSAANMARPRAASRRADPA
jgi:hypothetical protein